jgi:sulfite exporter TauE/SafE
MTNLDANLVTAFGLGLAGSSHCIGMCGGISTALGLNNTGHKLTRLLSYNTGRIASYCLLAALFGFLAGTLQSIFSPLTLLLRLVAALFLIAMGLYISGWWTGLSKLEHYGQTLWRPVSIIISGHSSGQRSALLMGLGWGLLPCGLIYSSLIWASTTAANPLSSALLMFSFGLGTLPAMLLLGTVGSSLQRFLRLASVKSFLGISIILMGCWSGGIAIYHNQAHQSDNNNSDAHSRHHHHH